MNNTPAIKKTLAKRYAKERRFRFYGLAAILLSIAFLVFMLIDIVNKSLPAFSLIYIKLPIEFSQSILQITDPKDEDELFDADYRALVNQTLYRMFPDITTRKDKRLLRHMISSGAPYQLRDMLIDDPQLLTQTREIWLIADDDIDSYNKDLISDSVPESERRVKDLQIAVFNKLKQQKRVDRRFNLNFFTYGDSREPEQAGILGAIVGSALTMLVTFLLSFPIGVAAAIYLEDFAPRNNRWIDFIEVNINNLAAVPSIVFGLLGLAIYLNLFGVPRSSALVGGLVLSLMTLPTIIIASRASLKSVPPSIREAALALGASKMQVTFHHVLPLATPGIMTGSIIGMAQALGETAPLLMIGMVAFVVDIPGGFLDPTTALPVQIFIWADSPERAFIPMTSAAIVVLLLFLLLMNLLAIILRKKFKVKW